MTDTRRQYISRYHSVAR